MLAAVGLGAFTGLVTVNTAESLKTENQINEVKIELGEVNPEEVEHERETLLADDQAASDGEGEAGEPAEPEADEAAEDTAAALLPQDALTDEASSSGG